MPTPFYVAIKGKRQGAITKGDLTADSVGNSFQEGHEDESLCQAYVANVTIPRDPQSGQPTSTRVHNPAVITKAFSKSSPLLWQALCSGEVLQIVAKFWRTSMTGQQEHYFTVKWTDAVMVYGKAYVPNALDTANNNFTHMEDWSFTYRMVEWTHEKGGTSGADDWRKPKT